MKNIIRKNRYLLAGMLAGTVITSSAFADSVLFSYTGGLQQQTIATSGTYYILGTGAQGGSANGGLGGGGTWIAGSVDLTAGTVLDIIVGESGATGNFGTDWGGGGGGGTFVWIDGLPDPLLIAGGGGGAGYSGTGGVAGFSYQEAGFSGTADNGGAGGSSGSGGQGGTGTDLGFNGGGGGGWTGAGSDGYGNAPGTGLGSAGGGGWGAFSFACGAGGCDDCMAGPFANGGFGGGGGGGWQGGGGGGGYSGGGGGDGSGGSGGAGGSFMTPSMALLVFQGGANQADGFLQIATSQSELMSTPEPGTFALIALSLIAVSLLPVRAKNAMRR